ncbi:multi-sensor signal transduction histidine kinase [Oscillatoria nigro-viridis PCC 7112]|uniref:histidine kinase n=1 Tax=Phormidium nigroviride PCC 7112 TaxID=179408 RepID=K9VHA2_9CYAN|nr:PAS domain S-box protein [Oscillatoria nigro-viridis]AFZ06877.1 multi-sensor signal transduction histidine kinase [Oscillatoria nigro-viridis PCC 7112]
MEYFKVKKFQISPYLAAISASIAILVGVSILDRSEQRRFFEYNRATTLDRLSTVRSKLEGSLNARLYLMRGLGAYLSNNPNITEAEFAATARILVAQQAGIRAITLVKGTTVAYIYPREGNEGAIGVDLTALPEQRQMVKEVIQTRKTLLAGPVKLLEGDETFISRSPIFLTPSGAEPETGVYWGLTGLILDKNSLIEEAGLNDSSAKLQYALRGKDGKGTSGSVFFGDGSIFDRNPVLLEVTLPNGSWQLAAIPAGGWAANSPFRGWLLFGGDLLALLTGVAVFSWVYGRAKLRSSEVKYRQLVENANSMIVQLDSEGKITFFNEFAETFFGYAEAEIIGKSAIGTIIPKTDFSESDLAAIIRDCLAQPEKYFQHEKENIRSNGERVWIAWTNKPLLDANGNLAGLLCIGTDISDRKQAEIALQASESELRALFAAMNDVILVIDIEGRYLKIAPTNPGLLYKPSAELVGKKVSELFEPEIADFCQEQIRTALATNQTCTFEYNLELASLHKWFAATISPMKENAVLWVARDITERKQAENWLTGQKQILEMIAKGATLGATLNTLVEIIEQQSRDVMGSILLLAPDGEHLLHGAAPSLPESYNAAIHGRAIGPDAGSCGTAAFTRQQVIVTDIASDPLWENYRDLALSFGLRSCLSTPIFSSQGQVLGTFGMYYSQPRYPKKIDLQLIEAAMNLAGIAIERKQAEESLKQLNQELESRVKQRTAQLMQTEERWQLALKGNNDGIWDWNLQTGELFLSDRFKEITGYDEHSPVVDYFDELNKSTHPDDLALVMQALQNHLNKKTPHYIIEYRCWCYNSVYKWILSRGQALWDASGKAVRMVGSITDITERKQAEEALRESEAKFQKLSANLPGIIYQFLLRSDGYSSFPYISAACRELFELEPEDVLQNAALIGNLIHPDDLQNHDESVAISAQALQPWQWEGRFVLPSGKIRWFQINSRPEAKENGDILWDGIAVDVTDRKESELALQESQQFIKKVAEATPGILYLYDLEEQRNIYTNNSLLMILGYTFDDLTAMDSPLMPQLVHPDDLPKILKYHASFVGIEDGETREIEYRVRAADGQILWLQSRDTIFSRNADGQAKIIIGVSQDITTRKQAEEALRQSEVREREKARDLESALLELRSTQTQLIQTEKMSSLGQLVAGIAHEINNPVNFIHANIDYLNQYTKQLLDLVSLYEHEYPEPSSKIVDRIQEIDLDFMAEDLRKLVGSMQVGTERIRQIVLSLRNFSRLDESAMKPVDIHAGIESTLLILQHRLKSRDSRPEIAIIKEFGKLPLVECYASQLNQVFMNILANAIDAIEERYHKLSLPQSETNSGRIAISTGVTLQNTVRVEISDNGTGISEGIVDRIFNPFFTTKAVGKGTGLGMSIAHSIVVEKHKGKIECISSIGCGTTFKIEIPIDKVYK